MAANSRAPKQWALTKDETINSFENWRQNLTYTLALDPNFEHFLKPGATWLKHSVDSTRGFQDDKDPIPEAKRLTAARKVTLLDLMLGQIANFCPIIARNSITRKSTSLDNIWQSIRAHYGFQVTGAHFLDLTNLTLQENERYEDLYQRLCAFFEDNLLKKDGGISHCDERITTDEELSPTVDNVIVYMWLTLINKDLPKLIKQRYGTELRSRTLASIKPEISQAMDSLLDELQSSNDARALRSFTTHPKPTNRQPLAKPSSRPYRAKSCPLCKAAKRADGHFLSECAFLPDNDRRFMTRARRIAELMDQEDPENSAELQDNDPQSAEPEFPPAKAAVWRVQTIQSPYIDTFYEHKTPRVVIDSGATANLISHSAAEWLGVPVVPSTQSAGQADGLSQLHVIGETRFVLTRDQHQLAFHGLVVKHLDVPLLAGTPFMETNDVYARPSTREVHIGKSVYKYGYHQDNKPVVRRASVLRTTEPTTVWPGEFLQVQIPPDYSDNDGPFSVEPRFDCPSAQTSLKAEMWPAPAIVSSVSRSIRIPYSGSTPKVLKRHEHFCQISPVFEPESDVCPQIPIAHTNPKAPRDASQQSYSAMVKVDPDNILSPAIKSEFNSLNAQYDTVFDPKIGCYNGAFGPFEATVNMGPTLPPQRKGRLPHYNHSRLVELQTKLDELECQGVLVKPETVGITVEYVNPSFLISKPHGGSRLVTAFAEVGQYAKPQPSLMPDVDSTLRKIGQWKYLIASDLTSAFYQIPLSSASLKYCGIVTPFKGIRTYARCAMGMPGSETALEELMCRILGELLQEGIVAKLADDLYCGANCPEDLLKNWARVLEVIQKAGLRLSPSKTIICPEATTVLGWIWRQGTLTASPHRIATLSTCDRPKNVKGLRSFIGAFKALSRVIPTGTQALTFLDTIVAGGQSSDTIPWSEDTISAFENAQQVLLTNKTITLPQASDQLWLVTDGALRDPGLGATLYVRRDSQIKLAGFFSAKLRQGQTKWLPCEIEALGIASATKHFSPYIIQSAHKTHILTDSKPCVQAYDRLCRGEFSASPRLTTFLATVARYQVSIHHLAGSSNIPSDFASRNAPPCTAPNCQVCTFVRSTSEATIYSISAKDVINGTDKLPFTTRSTWLALQSECRDLRRTCAHLKQGTRPSRKSTDVKDVKRYLQVASIAHDGLLIVKKSDPLETPRECILVPRQIVHGLLQSLHIKLNHPSRYQFKAVIQRYFWALDLAQAIDLVTTACHQCATLGDKPHYSIEQTTSDPPEAVGISYAADLMQRDRQHILVLREAVTSYTWAILVSDEKSDTLRNAILQIGVNVVPRDGPPAIIRTDNAPAFQSMNNDSTLKKHNIHLELGRTKNPNKNPIAERAIQELEQELIRTIPRGERVHATSLAIATAQLNSRIRHSGLSSREIWLQRDQFTNVQLPIQDRAIILQQQDHRQSNHAASESSKAQDHPRAPNANVQIGDIVYLWKDKSKHHPRDRYIVTALDGQQWCNIRKFIGTQLRNTSYRVKRSELFTIPFIPTSPPNPLVDSDDDTSGDSVAYPNSPVPSGLPPPQEAVLPTSDPMFTPPELSHVPPPETTSDPAPGHLEDVRENPPDIPQGSDRTTRPRRFVTPPAYLKDYVVEF